MIRCTPVCGPGPRLNLVNVVPFGWVILNETRVGLPVATGAEGWKSVRA